MQPQEVLMRGLGRLMTKMLLVWVMELLLEHRYWYTCGSFYVDVGYRVCQRRLEGGRRCY